jgi:hypothetical protein
LAKEHSANEALELCILRGRGRPFSFLRRTDGFHIHRLDVDRDIADAPRERLHFAVDFCNRLLVGRIAQAMYNDDRRASFDITFA